MPITWWDNRDGKFLGRTHDGQVLDITRKEVRVMSDVYANHTIATVFDEHGAITTVDCGYDFELCDRSGQVIVDAPEKALQTYHASKDIAAAQLAATEREAHARRLVLDVVVGSTVTVSRGRKVPVGTTGVVTRITSGSFGLRACVKDSTGAEHWTALDNLDVTHPMIRDGKPIPGSTWVDVREAMIASQPRLPIKGDVVRLKDAPEIMGVVFWVQGLRLGFKTDPNAEPTWADLYSVEVQTEDGTFVGSEIPKSDLRIWRVTRGNAAHLPAPLNRTQEVRATPHHITLHDSKGSVLIKAPVSSLDDVLTQLGLGG